MESLGESLLEKSIFVSLEKCASKRGFFFLPHAVKLNIIKSKRRGICIFFMPKDNNKFRFIACPKSHRDEILTVRRVVANGKCGIFKCRRYETLHTYGILFFGCYFTATARWTVNITSLTGLAFVADILILNRLLTFKNNLKNQYPGFWSAGSILELLSISC